MDHVYLEQMVKRETVPMDWVKRIGAIVLALTLCLIALNVFVPAFAIVLALSGWFVLMYWRRLDKEYEYIFTDGLLDVDCVYHRSNRRSMISLDSREFEIIAPASDTRYQSMFEKKYNKILDAGRGGVRENTYIAICNREGNTLKLFFEPNEELLSAMKKYLPRTLILAGDKRIY